jgi:hypothetical protein
MLVEKILCFSVMGAWSDRKKMGFPEDWSQLSKWINNIPVFENYVLPKQVNKVLCPDLPVLNSYHTDPPKEYWDKFPKKDLQ